MAPNAFQLSLDPATVLYLRKLAIRTRAGIPNHAVKLPRFSWGAEKARMTGLSERDLTKQFMRALASGWRAMQRPDADNGFASLIRVTSTDERFEFEMHCPHKQVLAPLTDATAREAIAQNPDANSVDIQYKFTLIDARCPVVFMWRHDKRDVLITNEYHLTNPNQFLSIDRVGTTSGFLNFIGVLNLLASADDQAGFVSQLPILLNEAMAQRADEWLRWFHHYVVERVIFDPKRVLVDEHNPESYFYNYSGQLL